LLDRIARDAGRSEHMNFEEIYLTDGSGLERRTRKHIIYAENDIEMTMDRGQQLFANNNIPLMINTGIVLLFCLYIVVGAPFLALDWPLWIQQALLLLVPLLIYVIQTLFRQHLLNEVLALQLLRHINGEEDLEDESVEAMEAVVDESTPEPAGDPTAGVSPDMAIKESEEAAEESLTAGVEASRDQPDKGGEDGPAEEPAPVPEESTEDLIEELLADVTVDEEVDNGEAMQEDAETHRHEVAASLADDSSDEGLPAQA